MKMENLILSMAMETEKQSPIIITDPKLDLDIMKRYLNMEIVEEEGVNKV